MESMGMGRRAPLRCAGAVSTVALGLLFGRTAGARSQDDADHSDDSGKPQDQQPVDPSTKKLMAARGLFQRGLFKLAAPEYEGFLRDSAGHANGALRAGHLPLPAERVRAGDAEGKFEEAAALLAVEDVYAYPQWSARALLEAGGAFEQLKQPGPGAAAVRGGDREVQGPAGSGARGRTAAGVAAVNRRSNGAAADDGSSEPEATEGREDAENRTNEL
jgi:hypothetical protein